tara:strand:- start:372 stop:539 length:168 start_codon:yes stop_codon:yes gene_type:complete
MNYTIVNITNKTGVNEDDDEPITALIYCIIILLCCCFGVFKFPKWSGAYRVYPKK